VFFHSMYVCIYVRMFFSQYVCMCVCVFSQYVCMYSTKAYTVEFVYGFD
jgi:hypothetical protein